MVHLGLLLLSQILSRAVVKVVIPTERYVSSICYVEHCSSCGVYNPGSLPGSINREIILYFRIFRIFVQKEKKMLQSDFGFLIDLFVGNCVAFEYRLKADPFALVILLIENSTKNLLSGC